jgi:hypothetical protein
MPGRRSGSLLLTALLAAVLLAIGTSAGTGAPPADRFREGDRGVAMRHGTAARALRRRRHRGRAAGGRRARGRSPDTRRRVAGLPRSLDGVPVLIRVTGPITALHHKPGHDKGGGGPAPRSTRASTIADCAGVPGPPARSQPSPRRFGRASRRPSLSLPPASPPAHPGAPRPWLPERCHGRTLRAHPRLLDRVRDARDNPTMRIGGAVVAISVATAIPRRPGATPPQGRFAAVSSPHRGVPGLPRAPARSAILAGAMSRARKP